MYLLENEVFANINGQIIKFGCRCKDENNNSFYFTNKEIEELNRQFKIKDEGWRHLCYIQMLSIEGNKIVRPTKVPKRYLDQLEYMGYNINLLEYESE